MVSSSGNHVKQEDPPVLDKAQAYVAAELSVIPIRADTTKAPSVEWKQFQQRPATANQLIRLFANGRYGIAILGGAVSGNLEILDFDRHARIIFPAWSELVEAEAPGLLPQLPVIRTPGYGRHVYYRCRDVTIPGNTKLAMDPEAPPKERVLIETRGEGGYVLAPGCPPACHLTGRIYEHVSGPDLCHVPTISAEERAILIRCARSFNRDPAAETSAPPAAGRRRAASRRRLQPSRPGLGRDPPAARLVPGARGLRQGLLAATGQGAGLERHHGLLHRPRRDRAVRGIQLQRRALRGASRQDVRLL
jgi:putative DNA primase/helicase